MKTLIQKIKRVDPMVWLCIVLVMACILLGWCVAQENARWSAFSEEHECVVVAKQDGEVFVTPVMMASGSVGVAVSSSSDTITWRCNDGIEYTR